jgi:hypothetical protein
MLLERLGALLPDEISSKKLERHLPDARDELSSTTLGAPTCRTQDVTPTETLWTQCYRASQRSTLREMFGYKHGSRTLVCHWRPRQEAGGTYRNCRQPYRDSRCASIAFAKSGSQAGYDEDSDEPPILNFLHDINASAAPQIRGRHFLSTSQATRLRHRAALHASRRAPWARLG